MQLKTGGVLTLEERRNMVQKRVEEDLEKARKMVAAAEQKRVATAKRAFEEVAKIARKKRRTSVFRPLYIVDYFGGGRELVRG